eukprot:NODE_43_length_28809_cov_0.237200.p22 type:complete len:103 gc:universal NODE_43_length_28809_cov_0.237200:14065-14373(+)
MLTIVMLTVLLTKFNLLTILSSTNLALSSSSMVSTFFQSIPVASAPFTSSKILVISTVCSCMLSAFKVYNLISASSSAILRCWSSLMSLIFLLRCCFCASCL